jgi:hypothetical protein
MFFFQLFSIPASTIDVLRFGSRFMWPSQNFLENIALWSCSRV